MIKRALTIAGSDSGGGAGIQADLKTFAALGVHGMSVITSITAQNTYEVRAVFDLPLNIIEAQFRAVVEDIGVDASKTGMLSNSDIVKLVANLVKNYGLPVVVDPVMIAKSGASLLKEEAVEALMRYLIPVATVVTPNKFEAERLAGLSINSLSDAKKAAKYIVEELGAQAVVLKGGHIEGDESVDILYYSGTFKEFRAKRIHTKNTHGTGCSFSAAITAELAKGKPIDEAVKIAKMFITTAIEHGLQLGRGSGPVNPIAWLAIPAEKFFVLENLQRAVEILEESGHLVSTLVPEVGMNIVMALPKPYAKGLDSVAGVMGRIVRVGGKVKAVGPIAFGASRHMARAVLKAMEFDERFRAVANIRFDEELIEIAKGLGYSVSFYDRSQEPVEIKSVEGATIPWGVEQAVTRVKRVPDIIYHKGDWGKEPMINVFGFTAVDVAEKILKLAKAYKEGKV
jgi:phosphomethylpyrimidine kinase|uniref:Bifunctional thiamine biosynthesis protein ThiDN n=1 Tax=Ignisphaera aggregans TaxID=334771 RepID=A0A7J3Z5W0_9CREN